MKLASIIDEHLICVGVPGKSAAEIYRNMLNHAAGHIDLPLSPEKLTTAICDFETTYGMTHGAVAMPHLRRSDFSDLTIIVGIPATPVKLTENDTEAAKVIILSLISPSTSDVYLKALAAFSRYLLQPGKLDQLAASGNAASLLHTLVNDNVTLKKNLTAEDVMTEPTLILSPSDNLSVALDIFNSGRRLILPVVDDNGKLCGELDATEVIKKFIPEYIFMMESTQFLVNFEPFEKIFREEKKHTVRDLMMPPRMTIDSQYPLIRLTISLVQRTAGIIFVTGTDGVLLGEISIRNIIHKVLRG